MRQSNLKRDVAFRKAKYASLRFLFGRNQLVSMPFQSVENVNKSSPSRILVCSLLGCLIVFRLSFFESNNLIILYFFQHWRLELVLKEANTENRLQDTVEVLLMFSRSWASHRGFADVRSCTDGTGFVKLTIGVGFRRLDVIYSWQRSLTGHI
jgi:hypothetical protein